MDKGDHSSGIEHVRVVIYVQKHKYQSLKVKLAKEGRTVSSWARLKIDERLQQK